MNLTTNEVDLLLRSPFTFEQRPRPVPADSRPLWRVPYVLLLISMCRGQRASLSQLHVLNWALRISDGSAEFAELFSSKPPADVPIIRYEPALERAIALATALELLSFSGKRWRLTRTGSEVLASIYVDPEMFVNEKSQLQSLGGPVSLTVIERLLRRMGLGA